MPVPSVSASRTRRGSNCSALSNGPVLPIVTRAPNRPQPRFGQYSTVPLRTRTRSASPSPVMSADNHSCPVSADGGRGPAASVAAVGTRRVGPYPSRPALAVQASSSGPRRSRSGRPSPSTSTRSSPGSARSCPVRARNGRIGSQVPSGRRIADPTGTPSGGPPSATLASRWLPSMSRSPAAPPTRPVGGSSGTATGAAYAPPPSGRW